MNTLKKPNSAKKKLGDKSYRLFAKRLQRSIQDAQINAIARLYNCKKSYVQRVLSKSKKSEKLKSYIKSRYPHFFTIFFNK